MNPSIIMPLVLSAAFIIGVAGIIGGIAVLRKSAATVSWPKAQGKIVSNSIEARASMDDQNMDSIGSVTTYTYIPHVAYEFKADNKTYSGKTIAIIMHTFKDEAKAQQFLADNYPVGKEVTVSYNPQKPGDTVLEPGYSSGGYFFITLGIIFALAGGIGLAVKLHH